MGRLANGRLLPPDFETLEAAEMMDIILRVRHFGRIWRDFLQTDLTIDDRAGIFIGTLCDWRT
ncbi:MAG: hypothetical protein BGP19_10190 [Thiobacillus sp. 0-1251]|jgi:hypothetical protein|nr:MAG: hypothetical protein ABT23_07315 [Thiobacillus sp. SCN 63-57]OJY56198.1 MAG: hypothetical protein BGP19_10190 [Thiobacillus sp. 0-1251]